MSAPGSKPASRLFSATRMLAALPRIGLCYRLSRRYLDVYNDDNNADIQTNGELRLLRAVLPGARVVFDVGANVGEWASLALSVNTGIELHCFEPSPTTFRQLASQRFPDGVVRNNIGLSSEAGEARLFIFETNAGINSLYERTGLADGFGISGPTGHETVRLDTLDGYCARHQIGEVDFCKVDVEGHELAVVKGMAASLRNRAVKLIQFEYGGCNIDSRVLLKDFFEYFQAYGYRLCKIRSRTLQLVDRYDQRLENFQYQNWLALAPTDHGLHLV